MRVQLRVLFGGWRRVPFRDRARFQDTIFGTRLSRTVCRINCDLIINGTRWNVSYNKNHDKSFDEKKKESVLCILLYEINANHWLNTNSHSERSEQSMQIFPEASREFAMSTNASVFKRYSNSPLTFDATRVTHRASQFCWIRSRGIDETRRKEQEENMEEKREKKKYQGKKTMKFLEIFSDSLKDTSVASGRHLRRSKICVTDRWNENPGNRLVFKPTTVLRHRSINCFSPM